MAERETVSLVDPAQVEPKNDPEDETDHLHALTIEQAFDAVGFGYFQKRLFVICGLGNFAHPLCLPHTINSWATPRMVGRHHGAHCGKLPDPAALRDMGPHRQRIMEERVPRVLGVFWHAPGQRVLGYL